MNSAADFAVSSKNTLSGTPSRRFCPVFFVLASAALDATVATRHGEGHGYTELREKGATLVEAAGVELFNVLTAPNLLILHLPGKTKKT